MIASDYKQERELHYRIIKEWDRKGASYCMEMFSEPIVGFLDMKIRHVDNRAEYYYDVTGLMQLEVFCKDKTLSYKKLQRLLKSIFAAMRRAEVYLLETDDILLDKEYIYIEADTGKAKVIYLEGYGVPIRTQLINLIEYFLDKINHKDEKVVKYIYSLYEMCREEETSIAKIEEHIYMDVVCEEKKRYIPHKTEPVKAIQEKKLDKSVETEKVWNGYQLYCSDKTEFIPLIKTIYILGRSAAMSDIVIRDNTVSRIHAKLEHNGKSWYIKDINSTNGTYVNQIQLSGEKRKKLHIGDCILLGETSYILSKN